MYIYRPSTARAAFLHRCQWLLSDTSSIPCLPDIDREAAASLLSGPIFRSRCLLSGPEMEPSTIDTTIRDHFKLRPLAVSSDSASVLLIFQTVRCCCYDLHIVDSGGSEQKRLRVSAEGGRICRLFIEGLSDGLYFARWQFEERDIHQHKILHVAIPYRFVFVGQSFSRLSAAGDASRMLTKERPQRLVHLGGGFDVSERFKSCLELCRDPVLSRHYKCDISGNPEGYIEPTLAMEAFSENLYRDRCCESLDRLSDLPTHIPCSFGLSGNEIAEKFRERFPLMSDDERELSRLSLRAIENHLSLERCQIWNSKEGVKTALVSLSPLDMEEANFRSFRRDVNRLIICLPWEPLLLPFEGRFFSRHAREDLHKERLISSLLCAVDRMWSRTEGDEKRDVILISASPHLGISGHISPPDRKWREPRIRFLCTSAGGIISSAEVHNYHRLKMNGYDINGFHYHVDKVTRKSNYISLKMSSGGNVDCSLLEIN